MSRRRTSRHQVIFPEFINVNEGHIIQIGGPRQTGRKDARWLTQADDGEISWSPNVFDAMYFTKGTYNAAIIAMTIAQTQKLPTIMPPYQCRQ